MNRNTVILKIALDALSRDERASLLMAYASEQEPMRDVLTIREVCEKLRISRPTLYRLAERGALRMVKIGRSVRIQSADVAALIAGKSVYEMLDDRAKKGKRNT